MKQIPNIEEVEELREIISKKHGGLGLCDYMFENTIVPFIHHQLQKARHDWLRQEIVKLEGMKQEEPDKIDYDGTGLSQYGFNSALQTIIDRYQVKLDQDKK